MSVSTEFGAGGSPAAAYSNKTTFGSRTWAAEGAAYTIASSIQKRGRETHRNMEGGFNLATTMPLGGQDRRYPSEGCPYARAVPARTRSMVNTQPRAREIAHVELAPVRFDSATADEQPQPEAGPLGAALHERPEDGLCRPVREAAALVLDADQDTIGR